MLHNVIQTDQDLASIEDLGAAREVPKIAFRLLNRRKPTMSGGDRRAEYGVAEFVAKPPEAWYDIACRLWIGRLPPGGEMIGMRIAATARRALCRQKPRRSAPKVFLIGLEAALTPIGAPQRRKPQEKPTGS